MNKKLTESKEGTAAPVLGLRARGKERRRNQIKDAARDIFVERGYELATTREIAERAEVSLGTLFAYAPTKSELLLMIVNDDLELIRDDRLSDVPDDMPLIDALTEMGRQDLVYWSKHPEIARQARREIAGVLLGTTGGPEAMRFAAWKPLLLKQVASFISRKQAIGRLSSEAPPELMAELWWCVYNQYLHNWLMVAKPNPRQGALGLRRMLALAIAGLGADPAEFGESVADDKADKSERVVPLKASRKRA